MRGRWEIHKLKCGTKRMKWYSCQVSCMETLHATFAARSLWKQFNYMHGAFKLLGYFYHPADKFYTGVQHLRCDSAIKDVCFIKDLVLWGQWVYAGVGNAYVATWHNALHAWKWTSGTYTLIMTWYTAFVLTGFPLTPTMMHTAATASLPLYLCAAQAFSPFSSMCASRTYIAWCFMTLSNPKCWASLLVSLACHCSATFL